MRDDHDERLTRLEQELNALLARQSERRLARLEQGLEKLSTIMIDLAETNSKVEDQLLRFIASQQDTNARLDRTLAAMLDLLQRPPNGH